MLEDLYIDYLKIGDFLFWQDIRISCNFFKIISV